MKAMAVNHPGKPDTLALMELPVPEPGPGEIRVRVQAASLNPVDYKVLANGLPAWTYPFVPGVDVAGIVDAVGPGVTTWMPGDRVVYHGDAKKHGGYAEYAVTTSHTVSAIPEPISFVNAAAFPCAGLTAYQAIVRKMNIRQGQTVFIHAGAGGVGGYAVQLAKAIGASRIMTSASAASFDYVKRLGADDVIDYNREDVVSRIMELTGGEGAEFILNTVSRTTAQSDLTALSFGGQLACIAGAPEVVADFLPFDKTFTIHKLMLNGAHDGGNRKEEEDLARMGDEFLRLMLEGAIDPMVRETISLEEIPEALGRLAQRHIRGKIVVMM